MATKPKKRNVPREFALVQFYGESLNQLRSVLGRENAILEKNHYHAADVGTLLNLRTQRGLVELALRTVADELNDQHGIGIPGATGWRMFDEYRFHPGPFPSISGLDDCIF